MAKWLSVRLQAKWLWIRIPFQSHEPSVITDLEKIRYMFIQEFNAKSRNFSSNGTTTAEGALN